MHCESFVFSWDEILSLNEIEAAIQEPELEKENEEICPLGPHGDMLCLAWHYSLCLL
jgi:hypothetical protein